MVVVPAFLSPATIARTWMATNKRRIKLQVVPEYMKLADSHIQSSRSGIQQVSSAATGV